jgi:cytochrome c oxidase subunit 2
MSPPFFRMLPVAPLAAAPCWPQPALGAYALNLPPPATAVARDIHELHTLVLWICVAIFVVVFVPMAIALWKHRRAAGHVARRFHDNFRLEVAWTIVPVLILVGMAWPATQTVLAMKDTTAAELTVKVTGVQWYWEYEYLDDGIRYQSRLSTPRDELYGKAPKNPHYLLEVDRPLVVPTGRKVRLVLTATDVIHSWWIPEFGVKQDAIPGFVRDTWFRVDTPGTYRGQCAELCGIGHAYMPVVVEALPPERFAAWRDEQLLAAASTAAAAAADRDRVFALPELAERGERVYQTFCAACHQASGAGIAGVFPPLDGSALVRGPFEAHVALVLNGKPGTAMAAFDAQLSDADLAAVVTYERNAWSNRAGDLVQPAQVAALRASPGRKP